jgi:glycosyltransferase involved in cell wall biosynthesis
MTSERDGESAASAIRVLHVLNTLRPSGVEAMLRCAASNFISAGVSGEILSTGAEIGPYAGALQDAGYIVHHMPFTRDLRFFLRLRQFVRSHRINLVHLHLERSTPWLALVLTGVAPVVRTVTSTFAFDGALRWRRCGTRWLTRMQGVRQLAVGPSVQRNEWERFRNYTEVCTNWYDSNHFRPPSEAERKVARRQYGLTHDDIAVIAVGNCAPVKNHLSLIRAMAKLSAKHRLTFLHAGIEDNQRSERALAVALGLSERMRFFGSVDDVLPLLHAADIFVMPSLREGMGISAVEAIASGITVLLSDVDGLRDLREWFGAIHYCSPDADGIANKLDRILQIPFELRNAAAHRDASTAPLLFGIEAGVQRYREIYTQVRRPLRSLG